MKIQQSPTPYLLLLGLLLAGIPLADLALQKHTEAEALEIDVNAYQPDIVELNTSLTKDME